MKKIVIALFVFLVLLYFFDMANKKFNGAYEQTLDENVAADDYCEKAWMYCVSGNASGIPKQLPTEAQCVNLRYYDSANGAKLNGACPPIPLAQ